MCARRAASRRRGQSGITFIELIMFILIVSIGVAGILSVMNVTTAASADPMVRKQAIAVAESLLEEIMLQPFTFCDPDDPNTEKAATAASCNAAEAMGPEAGETRLGLNTPFDNVNDYNGFAMNGIQNIFGAPIPALAAYSAAVNIVPQGIGGIPADESLQINVQVTGPGNTAVTLTGYRLRYAPQSP
jgi:MSHA pilin protein MshD